MRGLIKKLRVCDFKVGILSNASTRLFTRLETEGLDLLVDVTVCSGEETYQKPEIEIFKIFAAKLHVTLSELVYIDDSPKNLETASILGYRPILFNGYENLIIELKNLNVLAK